MTEERYKLDAHGNIELDEKGNAIKETRFKDWTKPIMEHGKLTKWNWLAYHPDKIIMGTNVDIGAFTCLFAHHGIELQDDVQIGGHCLLYSLNTENGTFGKITIKKGACIGAQSIIFPNVVIEAGEMIKAKSIVYINFHGRRVIK